MQVGKAGGFRSVRDLDVTIGDSVVHATFWRDALSGVEAVLGTGVVEAFGPYLQLVEAGTWWDGRSAGESADAECEEGSREMHVCDCRRD